MKNLRFMLRILSSRLGRELVNPVNSAIELIGSVCFFLLHCVSFGLVINKFTFPDWSVADLWIILFTFQAFTYAAFFLFWKGLIHTVRDIGRGAFDYLLTKPISNRILTFFRSGGLHNLICFVLSIMGILITIQVFDIQVSMLRYFGYLILLAGSLLTFHSVTVVIVSLNFFSGYLPATSSVGFQIQEIYKYPSTLFKQANIWIWITIIPFSLLTSIPAMYLLSKPIDARFWNIYGLFLILSLLGSDLIWNYSITNYSSSGS